MASSHRILKSTSALIMILFGVTLSWRFALAGDHPCQTGTLLDREDREELLGRLEQTPTGRQLMNQYRQTYSDTTLAHLFIVWDQASFSKRDPHGGSICIHLAQPLPYIEHVADMAHEMNHVVFLSQDALEGKAPQGGTLPLEDFIRLRLAGKGGEADAFITECQVKYESLGAWDHLCSPYRGDQTKVIQALYSGTLAASLTGDTYPILLARQYLYLKQQNREPATSKGQLASGPSKHKPPRKKHHKPQSQ